MATVNIGNLSFTHKGDYDGSTAYSKNDVVYYSTNGNAYIAKQATTGNVPTNATYWNQFAQGSGGIWNAGLSLGSAGQVVKVNSGATALEFGTAPSGKVLQYVNTHIDGSYSCNSNTYADFSGLPEFSITPSATSSKILLMSTWSLSTSNWNILKFQTKTGSGSYGDFLLSTGGSGSQLESHFSGAKYNDSDSNTSQSCSCTLLHSPNTTEQVSYKLQACTHDPNVIYINRTVGDHSSYQECGHRISNVMLMELEG